MNYLNSMKLDHNITQRLRTILWFEKCGQPFTQSLNISVTWVNDWQSASIFFLNPEWRNTTLEARNALTAYLAKMYQKEYQDWNTLVREAKSTLQDVFEKVATYQQEHKLNNKFSDCVRWDILAIVMESTYKHCNPPIFFSKLLTIYENGHFPCGWRGEWPNGNLIVI